MKGYSELNVFTSSETELFRRATIHVARVKDAMSIRCHELARAMGRILNLEVQDGYYGFVDHSWLWTTPLRTDIREQEIWIGFPNLLDVYSVGQLPLVRLLDCRVTALPHVGWSYRPTWCSRTDIDWEMVAALEKAMVGNG